MNQDETSIMADILFMREKADDILIRESHDRVELKCSCGWNGIYPNHVVELMELCPDCGHQFEDY